MAVNLGYHLWSQSGMNHRSCIQCARLADVLGRIPGSTFGLRSVQARPPDTASGFGFGFSFAIAQSLVPGCFFRRVGGYRDASRRHASMRQFRLGAMALASDQGTAAKAALRRPRRQRRANQYRLVGVRHRAQGGEGSLEARTYTRNSA